MDNDLQSRLDRFISLNLILKRRLRVSIIGNAILGFAVVVLVVVLATRPSALPAKASVVASPPSGESRTVVSHGPPVASAPEVAKPAGAAPAVAAAAPPVAEVPMQQAVQKKDLPSAVVPDGATPQEAYAIKVAARSARYGIDITAKLEDLGPQIPGEVPPDMIGKFYYAGFVKDSTDIDQLLTPHFMELTAETMARRDDSDDGQTVKPIHEARPISVWVIKEGFLTKASEKSLLTTVLRRTNEPGVFLLSEYNSRKGEVLRAPRFVVLKR